MVADPLALLDELDIACADVVGTDLGVTPSCLLAIDHPARVRRLVLIGGMVGSLPGAEDFLRGGPPWWFGFHAVPGLAERVLLGHKAEYLDFFLDSGSPGPDVTPSLRASVDRTYAGADRLRSAFEHYRALPTSARQVADAAAARRLTVPTMTIGASTVGEATFHQVEPIADSVVGHVLPDSGHIVAQHRPDELLDLLVPFLA